MLMLRPFSALTTIKVLSASTAFLPLGKTMLTDVGADNHQHQAVDFGQ